MKKTILSLFVTSVLTAGASSAFAVNVMVEVTNLTEGIHFTPLLVAAHDDQTHLFQEGDMASGALQAMAEGGDLSGLTAQLDAAGALYATDPAGGLLAPGDTATAMLDVRSADQAHISVVGMLLPTNDGFVGLEGQMIPHGYGVHTYYLNAYDAGTEGNDEIVNGGGAPGTPGIPADPTGYGGMDATGLSVVDFNPRVHIHPGVVGDDDPHGGRSDLDPSIHRWLNPVAKVTVTVGR